MTKLPDGNGPSDEKHDMADADTAERRALMRKLAVGAFAFPVVTTLLTTKAAAGS